MPDTESAPWPEREAIAAAPNRPEPRPSTPPPSQALSAVRREQMGQRPLAARRASIAALVEADPARKATVAAPAEPPRAAAAAASETSGADGILQRGQAAFDRGDYPEALRRGREAIAAGGPLGGHLLAGDAYYRLERFPDALREYQAALAMDPANASIKRRRDLAEKGAQ